MNLISHAKIDINLLLSTFLLFYFSHIHPPSIKISIANCITSFLARLSNEPNPNQNSNNSQNSNSNQNSNEDQAMKKKMSDDELISAIIKKKIENVNEEHMIEQAINNIDRYIMFSPKGKDEKNMIFNVKNRALLKRATIILISKLIVSVESVQFREKTKNEILKYINLQDDSIEDLGYGEFFGQLTKAQPDETMNFLRSCIDTLSTNYDEKFKFWKKKEKAELSPSCTIEAISIAFDILPDNFSYSFLQSLMKVIILSLFNLKDLRKEVKIHFLASCFRKNARDPTFQIQEAKNNLQTITKFLETTSKANSKLNKKQKQNLQNFQNLKEIKKI